MMKKVEVRVGKMVIDCDYYTIDRIKEMQRNGFVVVEC